MAPVAPTNRLTVLLANEQDPWHRTVRGLLEPQGVRTLSAHTGREALSLMETTPVHVAVLDIRMPQLDGLQVIKLMRQLPLQTPPTPILLADQLSNHLLHEALGMRVFSVLSKPVDYQLLLETMARIIRRYHNSRWPTEPGTS